MIKFYIFVLSVYGLGSHQNKTKCFVISDSVPHPVFFDSFTISERIFASGNILCTQTFTYSCACAPFYTTFCNVLAFSHFETFSSVCHVCRLSCCLCTPCALRVTDVSAEIKISHEHSQGGRNLVPLLARQYFV